MATNCAAQEAVVKSKFSRREPANPATFAYLLRVMREMHRFERKTRGTHINTRVVIAARTFLVDGERSEHVARRTRCRCSMRFDGFGTRMQTHTQARLLYANMCCTYADPLHTVIYLRWWFDTERACVAVANACTFRTIMRANVRDDRTECRARTCVRECVICYVIASAARLYQHTIRIMIVGGERDRACASRLCGRGAKIR